jgi:hypothetical protein
MPFGNMSGNNVLSDNNGVIIHELQPLIKRPAIGKDLKMSQKSKPQQLAKICS